MNLELKHLAPYLPYKLKGQVFEYKIDSVKQRIEELTGLEKWNEKKSYWGVTTQSNSRITLRSFKPIFNPILDLSLLVIEEFEKYDGKRDGKANEEVINLFCEENGVNEFIENIDLKSLPYECIEFMFKNHYDFFDLISKNLAISIHDVV